MFGRRVLVSSRVCDTIIAASLSWMLFFSNSMFLSMSKISCRTCVDNNNVLPHFSMFLFAVLDAISFLWLSVGATPGRVWPLYLFYFEKRSSTFLRKRVHPGDLYDVAFLAVSHEVEWLHFYNIRYVVLLYRVFRRVHYAVSWLFKPLKTQAMANVNRISEWFGISEYIPWAKNDVTFINSQSQIDTQSHVTLTD